MLLRIKNPIIKKAYLKERSKDIIIAAVFFLVISAINMIMVGVMCVTQEKIPYKYWII